MTATSASLLARIAGSLRLDPRTFEEVEADRGATWQAVVVVVLSSMAAGVGAAGFGVLREVWLLSVAAVALAAWVAWALLTYFIGTHLLPEPQTRADAGELLRTLGFASAPGLLRVLGVIPGATGLVFTVTALWMLGATVVAVRQALDYRSTTRAVAVCVIGWLLAGTFAVGIGFLFPRVVE